MRAAVTILTVLCCGGCADTIEEHESDSPWSIAGPELQADIVDTSGNSVLQFASTATRLSSGNIAVGDLYAAQVHFITSDGALIRSVGRRGSGPSDFGDIRWMGQCQRDSLFVWDYRLRRIAVLDSAGAWIRSIQPTPGAHLLGCSERGLLTVLDIHKPPSASEPRLMSTLSVLNVDGGLLRELGAVPFGETRVMGRLTQVAQSNEALFVATADSAGVLAYNPTDGSSTYIRVPLQAQSPSPANYAAAVDEAAGLLTNSRIREQFRDQQLTLGAPEQAPLYRHAVADPLGAVWLVTSLPGDKETRLSRVAPDGSISQHTVPQPMHIFEIGADYILGRAISEDGSHRIVLYSFSRS